MGLCGKRPAEPSSLPSEGSSTPPLFFRSPRTQTQLAKSTQTLLKLPAGVSAITTVPPSEPAAIVEAMSSCGGVVSCTEHGRRRAWCSSACKLMANALACTLSAAQPDDLWEHWHRHRPLPAAGPHLQLVLAGRAQHLAPVQPLHTYVVLQGQGEGEDGGHAIYSSKLRRVLLRGLKQWPAQSSKLLCLQLQRVAAPWCRAPGRTAWRSAGWRGRPAACRPRTPPWWH